MNNFDYDPLIGLNDANAFPRKPGAVQARNQFMVLLNQAKDFINGIVKTIYVGEIKAFGGATAPTGTLLCNGSAISRTTYAALFTAIGTLWGVGDGSTTFNLPNLKGETLVGLDASQTEFNTLGKMGGEKAHILTQAELPAYNLPYDYATTSGASQNALIIGTKVANSVNGVISSGGSGLAHNNLQPYTVVNYIIVY